MIEFRVLGTLDLRERPNGSALRSVLAQPKRTAVLAYLALAKPRGFQRRDTLLATFWPEATEERARNSLNQSVFVLRRALGNETIVTRGADDVGLDVTRLWCDAVGFEEALDAGEEARALELYGGELLQGFHLADCVTFEHWLEAERKRLRGRALGAALAVAGEHEAAGNPVEAVYWVRRALSWSPYDEAVLRRLLTLLGSAGDRAGAIREYEAFRERLATELELEPSPETEALARDLRREGGAGVERVAAVEGVAGAQRVTAAPAEVRVGPGGAPPATDGDVAGSPPAGPSGAAGGRWRLRTWVGIGVAAGLVLAAAVLLPRTPRPEGPALDGRRVLVAQFANRTGEPTLDPLGLMAGDWIAQGLARSGLVHVVPISTVLRGRRDIERDAGRLGDEEVALRLARELGAGYVVSGALYAHGDSVVFEGRILAAGTGEVVRAVGEVGGLLADPASAVETLRRRMLGSMATLTDARLASWASPGDQPPDLESYRLLAAGFDRFFTASRRRQLGTDNAEADRLNRQAAELFVQAAGSDSGFVTPLLWAVFARENGGDRAAADSLLQALARRTDLSPWERALMEYQRAHARADREEAYRRARALVELAPESEWLYALATAAYDTRRYHAAIAALERVDPDRGWIKDFPSYWHLRIETRHSMGDHAGELRDVRELRARFPADRDVPRMELIALAALGRSDELLARVHTALATGDRRVTPWLAWLAQELIAHGHRKTAERVVEAGLDHFQAPPPAGDERFWLAARARLLEAAGRWEAARSVWEGLAARHPENDEYAAHLGVLAARRGDRTEAERIDARLRAAARGPGAVFDPNGGPLIWRARIAAQLGERERATALIGEALDRGMRHGYLLLHAVRDLDPLRGYAPYDELLRPRD